MLDIVLKYSGICSIVVTWLLVVGPAAKAGLNSKKQTISSLMKDKKVSKYVTTGLIVGAMFQVLFLNFLITKFDLNFRDIGSVLFLTTNLSTIMVALLPDHKYPKIHSFFVIYYFLVNPISLLLIAYAVKSSLILLVTAITVFLYFLGTVKILQKDGICAKVEQWAFLTLSVLTIVLTVI